VYERTSTGNLFNKIREKLGRNDSVGDGVSSLDIYPFDADLDPDMMNKYIQDLERMSVQNSVKQMLKQFFLASTKSMIRREVDELNYLIDKMATYVSLSHMIGEVDTAPHWFVFRALCALHDEFIPSTPYLQRLLKWFELQIVTELELTLPTREDLDKLRSHIRAVNENAKEKLPPQRNGEKLPSFKSAIESLKGWKEKYEVKGIERPENEEEAIALCLKAKGCLFGNLPQAVKDSPIVFALFLAFAGELPGPGGNRHEYRAMADVFTNFIDEDGRILKDGKILHTTSSEERDTFGWATIPSRLFTERHLRLLRGDITTPSVVKLGNDMVKVRNRLMPRYHLQLIRVRSIRSEQLDQVLNNERRSLAIIVTVLLGIVNILRYTQISMFLREVRAEIDGEEVEESYTTWFLTFVLGRV
jgi:hypothetical protein